MFRALSNNTIFRKIINIFQNTFVTFCMFSGCFAIILLRTKSCCKIFSQEKSNIRQTWNTCWERYQDIEGAPLHLSICRVLPVSAVPARLAVLLVRARPLTPRHRRNWEVRGQVVAQLGAITFYVEPPGCAAAGRRAGTFYFIEKLWDCDIFTPRGADHDLERPRDNTG